MGEQEVVGGDRRRDIAAEMCLRGRTWLAAGARRSRRLWDQRKQVWVLYRATAEALKHEKYLTSPALAHIQGLIVIACLQSEWRA